MWIGATIPASTTVPQIDNPGYNQTLTAMGIDPDEPQNANLDGFDATGVVGGLTAAFAGAGPLVVFLIGVIIAYIMFVKYDGSLFIPGLVFMATGAITGGIAYAAGYPGEAIIFCIGITALGSAGALFEALVARS
jgi:hypothetical protein